MLACLIGLTTGCGGSSSASEPRPQPLGTPPRIAGGLTWADDFDGPAGRAPDPSKWGHDIGGNGWGNNELQYYTDSTDNAALDGQGNLVITARKDGAAAHTCSYGPCQFTSARLSTARRFTQTYGRFEARIKVPRGRGMLPAFWLLGDDIHTVGWPANGEIDIMEYPGKDRGTIHGSVHGPGHSTGGRYTVPGGHSVGDDFHTFTLDWTPDALAFSVDGVQYERITAVEAGKGWVYNHPFFIVLNVAVGGKWPGTPDGHINFPQEMVVDYVRVYTWNQDAATSSRIAPAG